MDLYAPAVGFHGCFVSVLSEGRKKTTVTVPSYEGETKLPHTGFIYTYEVLDDILPTENSLEDVNGRKNLETGLKLKPFHKLESKEKEQTDVRSVPEFVLNTNYTFLIFI